MKYEIEMPEGWKPRAHNNCDFCKKDLVCHKHFGICPLSHAVPVKEVEPLEELAKRNGFWKTITLDGVDSMANGFVSIEIEREVFDISKTPKRTEIFVAPTYAAAEQAARAYLEGLKDKGVGE